MSTITGFKITKVDGTTWGGFRWPLPSPGERALVECDMNLIVDGTHECPQQPGDGLMVAKTLDGACSGGIDLSRAIGLYLEYDEADVLGEGPYKVRVSRVVVTGVFDPIRLIRTKSETPWDPQDMSGLRANGADLRSALLDGVRLGKSMLMGADLDCASLDGADLRYCNLRRAYLAWVSAVEADFRGSYATSATFTGASLTRAKLNGAYLTGAMLNYTKMTGADLTYANLGRADLLEADLEEASLRGANLTQADLSGANLQGADLSNASYDITTMWPDGFDPQAAGAVFYDRRDFPREAQ